LIDIGVLKIDESFIVYMMRLQRQSEHLVHLSTK